MSSAFPKFVIKQGSESDDGKSKMTVDNAELYKTCGSGILYEDVYPGREDGMVISTPDQEINIQYLWLGQDGIRLSGRFFSNSVKIFCKEFDFDLTKGIMDMRAEGLRRFIIPPEINKTDSYRVLELTLFSIKDKINSNYVKAHLETIVAALGGPQVVLRICSVLGVGPLILGYLQVAVMSSNTGINLQNEPNMYPALNPSINGTQTPHGMANQNASPAQNPYINETLTQRGMDNQNRHPAKNLAYNNIETKPQPQEMPKQWGAGVGPRITYQVVKEGEGEVISKHQKGCFQYRVDDSTEVLSFEGSPTELAIKLGSGFEDAMLEAIVGMKINGRRIITIPHKVSNFGEDTVLDLKLTVIRDLNLRCRI